MRARLERQTDSGVCVMHVEGDLDISVVPEVRRDLEGALESGCKRLVFDLAGVTYADSSALGLLVWLDKRLAPLGGRLVLAGANRDITRVLEISGLVSVAPTISSSPNTDAAIEGFGMRSAPTELLWQRSIEVPAEMEHLASTRREVVDLLAPVQMSEASLFDIKVAVGEALANAIRHGSPGGSEDLVRIDVSAYDDRVVIGVSDRGRGFDGNPIGSEQDVYASSGRGVLFMRALMDSVSFTPTKTGGTKVTLVKHLSSGT